jgi:putative membrane protein
MTLTALNAITLADHGWGHHGSWWVLFPIFWFLFVATVVTFIILNVRRRGRLSGQRAGERRLAERYASGEIDDQEYKTRLATLKELS